MTRARTDMSTSEVELAAHLKTIREAMKPQDDTPEDYALCALECFVDISLRLMKKTNPSKIRDIAMVVEIKARMDGIEVIRGAA